MRTRETRSHWRRSVQGVFWFLAGVAGISSLAAALPNIPVGGWKTRLPQHDAGANTWLNAGPSSPSGITDVPHGLEGTWRVIGAFASGGADRALFTFGAGRDGEGVVVHTDNLYFVAAPSCLPSQGAWKREKGAPDNKTYIAIDEGFCFDTTNNFAPAGTLRFETEVTLSDKWTQLNGRLHLVAFDPDGNQVFEDFAVIQGTRMEPVVPPPAP